MTKRLVYAFCIIAACVSAVATVSCTKLEPAAPKMMGPLVYESARFANAIPDEYGALVGVTQNTQNWAGLWFQKPDKTITVVFVNVDQGKIFEKVLTIPRK